MLVGSYGHVRPLFEAIDPNSLYWKLFNLWYQWRFLFLGVIGIWFIWMICAVKGRSAPIYILLAGILTFAWAYNLLYAFSWVGLLQTLMERL